MSQPKHSQVSLPIAEELRRELIVRFLAELMQVTGNPESQDAFQAALKTYCDNLHPWRPLVIAHPIHGLSSHCWRIAPWMRRANTLRWCYPQKPKPCFWRGSDAIRAGVMPDYPPRMPGLTDVDWRWPQELQESSSERDVRMRVG